MKKMIISVIAAIIAITTSYVIIKNNSCDEYLDKED